EQAVAPLLAGIFFGILYGAGVIADLIKKQGVNKKQVLLVSVFLAMCHAIFEDTGLFLVLGANIFWLTVPRLILAFGLVFLTNQVFAE
ncbi:MAG: nucleoside recognition protein, partial [bacterium]